MRRIRFKLRSKMMLFAAVIAVLPLVVAGQSLIRVARDELKSAANEQLAVTARKLADGFNDFFESSVLTPLDLIRNAIGGEKLGFDQKIVILRQGIADLPDVVALQVDVEGLSRPIIVAQEAYFKKLQPLFPAPLDVLKVDAATLQTLNASGRAATSVVHIAEIDDWLATASLPIEGGIGGRKATLHARIDLARLYDMITVDPFAETGTINVVSKDGSIIFSTQTGTFDHASVMSKAQEMLANNTATVAVEPFQLADGSISLGAIALPRAFPWAIVVEKAEGDAYRPIADMIQNLLKWLGIGLAAAIGGAALFALGISRPILRITGTAQRVATGDLDARVGRVRSGDEIGELAVRFDEMIVQLSERFELQKFVSRETMKAIQGSDRRVVSLGGERRRAAMLFADIRGYTAFSETRDPEEVVAVLNGYFQQLSEIVAANHGDIDKFVGDEIMAVFDGAKMTKHAVQCAIEIMRVMEALAPVTGAHLAIGIGVHTGEVLAGAMGSRERKDFTVIGDAVNLTARLCSKAQAGQTLVTRAVMEDLPSKFAQKARQLEPITVKGKTNPIEVFAFYGPSACRATG
jgi:adenylate cyclase